MTDLYDGFEDLNDNIFNRKTAESNTKHETRETTAASFSAESIRPMTSNKAAGYSSLKTTANKSSNYFRKEPKFTQNNADLHNNDEDSLSNKAEQMENTANSLLSRSIFASASGDYDGALKLAQNARKKENEVSAFREKHSLEEQLNTDLTFAVLFNLGYIYELKRMYTEALTIYNSIISGNQALQTANNQIEIMSRVRLQIGNIYYEQEKYELAIKMYRMSLDQIGDISYKLKMCIMRNIGNAFLKLGQFVDAIQSFEHIVEIMPDVHTVFNLLVAYYTLGDKEKMKKGFVQLLNCSVSIPVNRMESDSNTQQLNLQSDEYAVYVKSKWLKLSNYIKQSIQLIGKAISDHNVEYSGYDWLIDRLYQIRSKHEHVNETKLFFDKLILHVVVLKGIEYLKNHQFEQAMTIFNEYNEQNTAKSNHQMNIFNNLAFINFLKSEYSEANKYSLAAVNNDRYNAASLVNRANCLYVYGEYEAAKEMYLEAIGVEADCIGAIYNLGLICKKMGNYNDALQAFKKLNKMETESWTQSKQRDAQILYQICNLYELLQDYEQCIKWYKILHSIIPSDASVLIKLANLYKVYVKDETLVYHNYLDSYKLNRCNINIISWIGIWYINNSLYENAVSIFRNAALIQSREIKWTLMIASCYRRMRNFQKAIAIYKKILSVAQQHNEDDIKIKCLQYLCTIMKQIDHPELQKYQNELDIEVQLHEEQQQQLEEEQQRDTSSQPTLQQQQQQQQQPAYAYPQQQQHEQQQVRSEHGETQEDQNWADVQIDDELLPS
eukprot:CAMPEP_0197030388 /NCGR_PEP_ID=MMETSP1384-20130603/9631_1 /TAXON_ID=29189 /ORGANISM="Ammonia sp." /LENGTH=780 /DNA_ID=CAMNT_0042459721 /DNA_START=22 /DNA_END=2364 /DNA_ORIENTATION=-